MQYFVVMIDYGRRGREAIVDPEVTRREVVSRVASGEYKNISFIHEIADSAVDDITAEILAEAALPEIPVSGADLQAGRFRPRQRPPQGGGMTGANARDDPLRQIPVSHSVGFVLLVERPHPLAAIGAFCPCP